MRAKYREDVSEEWDLQKIKTKEEMVITNTYINTRILMEEANQENTKEEEKDTNTFREQLQANVPPNNRNIGQKSSTYNNEIKATKPTTRIKFKEEIKTIIHSPLEEPNLAKRVKNLPEVNCHREETALSSILCNKEKVLKPIPVMPSQKMSNKNKNNSFIGGVGIGLRKINESLEQDPSSKLYQNDSTPKETKTNKAKKRVKSARPKDKKDKMKSKKDSNKYDYIPGFQPHAYLQESRPLKKGKKKPSSEKGERKKKSQATTAKQKNNFFQPTKGKMSLNPSTNEFQNILNKSGLSDIDMTKKFLLNKIANNETDADKYMKFIEAKNRKNAPDEEAKEIKGKKKNSKTGPVVNVNYNSYIRIGAYPPPVINTLIVNGNNYINHGNPHANKNFTEGGKNQKSKILASSGSSKTKTKARPSSGAQAKVRQQYGSVNTRSSKIKEPASSKKPQDAFNLVPFSVGQKNKLTTPTNQRDKPKKFKKSK
eukprot:CAMPEP_0197019350 /NCGR_PEP_ID=MMETSP1380-20130617/80647_1 /TAXON_ID=5936 /ORGANISM="Euplotes crassus, Strain CT5" /LENGTH=483 /DNA_ID=CAMNT_0042446753 /DNA_START=343 /DNA_END=1794 /DNA_ORIENTATION=-